jgi:hypothetical protein
MHDRTGALSPAFSRPCPPVARARPGPVVRRVQRVVLCDVGEDGGDRGGSSMLATMRAAQPQRMQVLKSTGSNLTCVVPFFHGVLGSSRYARHCMVAARRYRASFPPRAARDTVERVVPGAWRRWRAALRARKRGIAARQPWSFNLTVFRCTDRVRSGYRAVDLERRSESPGAQLRKPPSRPVQDLAPFGDSLQRPHERNLAPRSLAASTAFAGHPVARARRLVTSTAAGIRADQGRWHMAACSIGNTAKHGKRPTWGSSGMLGNRPQRVTVPVP